MGTEADIIRIPAIFEEVRGCGDATAALIPGTANLQLYTHPDGTTDLFIPDPFFRASADDLASDPVISRADRFIGVV